MKRIFAIACIVLSFSILTLFVSSCGASSALYGTWQDSKDIVEFKSNGTFESQYYFMSGKYTISNDEITMSIPLIGNDIYKFSVEGNTLTLQDTASKTKYVFTKVK